MLNLSYEYNDDVIGYVVSDEDSNRTVNFQFELYNSNHPAPAYYLTWGCPGDETQYDWTEEELKEVSKWLRSHDDVDLIEDAFTKAMYENDDFKENVWTSSLSYNDILEASEQVDNENA